MWDVSRFREQVYHHSIQRVSNERDPIQTQHVHEPQRVIAHQLKQVHPRPTASVVTSKVGRIQIPPIRETAHREWKKRATRLAHSNYSDRASRAYRCDVCPCGNPGAGPADHGVAAFCDQKGTCARVVGGPLVGIGGCDEEAADDGADGVEIA